MEGQQPARPKRHFGRILIGLLIFCVIAALIGSGVFIILKSQPSSSGSASSNSSLSSSDSQAAALQVDFDLNGYDSIAAPAVQSVFQGGYAVAPSVARIGYTLEGWSTLASGGDFWDFAEDPITADTTLYAQWELDVYAAHFDLAGGSGPSIPDQSENYLTYQESGGSTAITSKLSAPTGSFAKDGYVLDGWWAEDSGGSFVQEWNFGSDLLLHDVILHAGWGVSKAFGPYAITEYDTAVKITGYDGASAGGVLTIPSSINGKPVLSIGTKAFYGFVDPDTSEILLPNSLTTIGEGAFQNSSCVYRLTIPDSVTSIGKMAFDSCDSLYTLKIGSGVRNIGEMAFYQSIYLGTIDKIEFPGNVLSIESEAFSITGDGSRNPLSLLCFAEGLQYLGSGAFDYACCGELVLPNSLVYIARDSFAYCHNLTALGLGTGLDYIGYDAFVDTDGSKLYVSVDALIPPGLGGQLVFGYPHETRTSFLIKVPVASYDAYKADAMWSFYYKNYLTTVLPS